MMSPLFEGIVGMGDLVGVVGGVAGLFGFR